VELQKFGQSVWYDNISRGLITSGELERRIREEGLRGVTSNPSIFEKAISRSRDYDEAIGMLMAQNKSALEIFETLAIEDIQKAADLFRPLYESTGGADGYVSIEVSPKLAYDTERTIKEARQLAKAVHRRNVFIKVPGTPEGGPAIEQLIADGINVNVTLLFSLASYEQVAEAYIKGLEKLAQKGRSLEGVASVASFFVSRVDTLVDRLLEVKKQASKDLKVKKEIEDLFGKAAIANAKLAYEKYKTIFGSQRFQALHQKGARIQRALWASTSTKSPRYRDVLYVEELIGSDTVNTLPESTWQAFKDHGQLRTSLEENVEGAHKTLERLGQLGIDFNEVTQRLQKEGVKLFIDSFEALIRCISAKREKLEVSLS